jgi:rubrerythrin
LKANQLNELLLQSLETEKGGVLIYRTALTCVVNEELKEEWEKYLDQTTHHVEVMQELFGRLGLDSEQQTPGRRAVRHIGESLVAAMNLALRSGGPPEAAELVACECVTLAETKDHANWELIGQCAETAKGKEREALKEACEAVEDQEDEHVYHSKGWCRELWIDSLGMPAVLPPPEEEKDVKTAIGAARAQQSRKQMLKK